jgi:HEAT repeat protein
MEGKGSLEALKGILSSSKDEEVQKAALFAIANHGGEGVKEILFDTALNHPNEKLAETSVYALQDLLDGKETEILLELMKKSKYPGVKKAVLFSLVDEEKGAASVKVLSQVVREEKDPELRKQAIFALGQTKSDEAVPVLLEVAKKDKDVKMATAAVMALGEIGTPKAKAALMEILERKQTEEKKTEE